MRPPETLGQAVFRILPQRDLLRLLPVLQEHQVIQQQEAVMRALQLSSQSPTRYKYLSFEQNISVQARIWVQKI